MQELLARFARLVEFEETPTFVQASLAPNSAGFGLGLSCKQACSQRLSTCEYLAQQEAFFGFDEKIYAYLADHCHSQHNP